MVGTYFGVKQSADARQGAEELAINSGLGNTAPTVTITPSTAIKAVNDEHMVTAIVTSVDGSRAAKVAVTFTVTNGPDVNTTGVILTDTNGQAEYQFKNNGIAGTDTIEATALQGRARPQ